MAETLDRRAFLRTLGTAGMTLAAGPAAHAMDASRDPLDDGVLGVLTDLTQCIGCRKCEWACSQAQDLPSQTVQSFEDRSVFGAVRRPDAAHYTVVNRYEEPGSRPRYVKVQCMHCNEPACASACIVSAFQKQGNGAVTYDAWRCMGCRYCMIACPFEIPGYEYDDPLTPLVRKCTLCFERISTAGGVPACVEICPPQCLTFGKRADLLALARAKIARHPEGYNPHIYGEHEVGGTSWLYLADRPFAQLGFPVLPERSPRGLTESIQHGIFKHFVPPLALFGVLGSISWLFRRQGRETGEDHARLNGGTVDAGAESPPRSPEPDVRCEPVRQRLLSPGVWALLAVVVAGAFFGAMRFTRGLGAATHLSDRYPWGLWIAFDVATGVALAAGGFTTAALVHIFHRERYRELMRPALLSALLGYTFVVLGLLADLGRYYNVWHPLLPSMWSGNSVLFEVGMCVMTYLTVLYFEFVPIVTERFIGRTPPWLDRILRAMDAGFHRVMLILILSGVVLSCLHQSSLGSLMLIAPGKMDPLWFTPILPLLFLLSAIAVGYPMVIFEALLSARAFRRRPEMHVLSPLARFTPVFLGVYLAFKLSDLAIRGTMSRAFDGSAPSTLFLVEITGGVMLPLVLLLSERIRRSPRGLLLAALLAIAGVVLNRVNVFLTAYTPVYPAERYVPSLGEFAVSAGLVAALVLVNRIVVRVFPVLPAAPQRGTS